MDVYYFTEMPDAEFPESEAEKFPSMPLTFPNTYFDPQLASELFRHYLDEYQDAEEVGFDGLMINEPHNTPSCMDVEVSIPGGILARITRRAKILILGNLLPTTDIPVRLAEEIAMVDVISGGRLISGVVHGIGVESWATNTNPVYNRERFEECHDLLIKTWTTPGPFRLYHKHAEEVGYTPGPEHFAYMICCHVNDTDGKAQEQWRHSCGGWGIRYAPPGLFLPSWLCVTDCYAHDHQTTSQALESAQL